jgi:hypothetical protein
MSGGNAHAALKAVLLEECAVWKHISYLVGGVRNGLGARWPGRSIQVLV